MSLVLANIDADVRRPYVFLWFWKRKLYKYNGFRGADVPECLLFEGFHFIMLPERLF